MFCWKLAIFKIMVCVYLFYVKICKSYCYNHFSSDFYASAHLMNLKFGKNKLTLLKVKKISCFVLGDFDNISINCYIYLYIFIFLYPNWRLKVIIITLPEMPNKRTAVIILHIVFDFFYLEILKIKEIKHNVQQ